MSETVSIMMIEDDEGHARLIEKNLRRAGITNPIHHLKDGASALAALLGEHDSEAPHHEPCLVLLDLNLPDMSGSDILKRIKQDPAIRRLPVIVLTTADDKVEIQRCYDLGCNVYITKPLAHQRLADAIQSLGLFLSVVQLPSQ